MDYYEKLFGTRYYYRKAYSTVRLAKWCVDVNRPFPDSLWTMLEMLRYNYPHILAAAYRSLQMREADAH